MKNSNTVDQTYKDRLRFILESPLSTKSNDRTGTGTLKSVVMPEMVFDLREGFPLLGLKKTSIKNIFHELNWMLQGSTNIKYMVDNGCNIWNDNSYDYYLKLLKYPYNETRSGFPFTKKEFIGRIKQGYIATDFVQPNGSVYYEYRLGDVGLAYGSQWRYFAEANNEYGEGIDQIQNAIDLIRTNPESRRIIVSAWNPSEIHYTALPPCHFMFQFLVHGENLEYLSLKMDMRSNDFVLGAPYNIASYALLLEFIAQITGKTACFLRYNVGDAHIYNDHIEAAKELVGRECTEMPKFRLNGFFEYTDPAQFKLEDFFLEGYKPHPAMNLKMSV